MKVKDLMGNKKALAIILSVVIVASSLTTFFYINSMEKERTPNVYLPVKFMGSNGTALSPSFVTANGHPYMNGYNLSNFSVQIFSEGPSTIFSNQGHSSYSVGINNSTNNPYYIEMFTGSPNSQGVITGQLNSAFGTILKDYRSLYSQHGGISLNVQVSMEVDASYQYMKNGSLYIYHYFNEMPFSSYNVHLTGFSPYTFHQTILMNMNQQPTTMHVNKANTTLTPERQIGGGNPPICKNQYVTKVSTYYGTMPYYIGVVNHTTIPINNELSMTFSTHYFMNPTVGVSSMQSYDKSAAGIILSSNPSWSGTEQTSGINLLGVGVNSVKGIIPPDQNIAVIGYRHFEMQDIYQTVYHYSVNGSYYTYDGKTTTTTLKLLNANNGNFDLVANSMGMIYRSNYSLDPIINTIIGNIVQSIGIVVPSIHSIDNINFTQASQSYMNSVTNRSFNVNGFNVKGIALADIGIGIAVIGILAALKTEGANLTISNADAIIAGMGLSWAQIPALTTTTYYGTAQSSSDFVDFSLSNPQSVNVTTYMYVAQGSQTLNGLSYQVPVSIWNVTQWG